MLIESYSHTRFQKIESFQRDKVGLAPSAEQIDKRRARAAIRHVLSPAEFHEVRETLVPAAAARGDSVPLGQSMMDYYLQRSLGAAQIKFTKPGD